MSATQRCIQFIDIYRFLSSCLDYLATTFVGIKQKTLENFDEVQFLITILYYVKKGR